MAATEKEKEKDFVIALRKPTWYGGVESTYFGMIDGMCVWGDRLKTREGLIEFNVDDKSYPQEFDYQTLYKIISKLGTTCHFSTEEEFWRALDKTAREIDPRMSPPAKKKGGSKKRRKSRKSRKSKRK
jgi:hypothetical protein